MKDTVVRRYQAREPHEFQLSVQGEHDREVCECAQAANTRSLWAFGSPFVKMVSATADSTRMSPRALKC